jgi:hypothetical protein
MLLPAILYVVRMITDWEVAALVTRIDTSRLVLCIQIAAPELVDSGGRVEQTDVP